MVLVTGPTGSGKTSTLYGMLQETDARSRNIVTLEDPIEYRFNDVVQAQTNPRMASHSPKVFGHVAPRPRCDHGG